MGGTTGPPGEWPGLFRDLPQLDWKTLALNEQNMTRCRQEVPVSPSRRRKNRADAHRRIASGFTGG